MLNSWYGVLVCWFTYFVNLRKIYEFFYNIIFVYIKVFVGISVEWILYLYRHIINFIIFIFIFTVFLNCYVMSKRNFSDGPTSSDVNPEDDPSKSNESNKDNNSKSDGFNKNDGSDEQKDEFDVGFDHEIGPVTIGVSRKETFDSADLDEVNRVDLRKEINSKRFLRFLHSKWGQIFEKVFVFNDLKSYKPNFKNTLKQHVHYIILACLESTNITKREIFGHFHNFIRGLELAEVKFTAPVIKNIRLKVKNSFDATNQSAAMTAKCFTRLYSDRIAAKLMHGMQQLALMHFIRDMLLYGPTYGIDEVVESSDLESLRTGPNKGVSFIHERNVGIKEDFKCEFRIECGNLKVDSKYIRPWYSQFPTWNLDLSMRYFGLTDEYLDRAIALLNDFRFELFYTQAKTGDVLRKSIVERVVTKKDFEVRSVSGNVTRLDLERFKQMNNSCDVIMVILIMIRLIVLLSSKSTQNSPYKELWMQTLCNLIVYVINKNNESDCVPEYLSYYIIIEIPSNYTVQGNWLVSGPLSDDAVRFLYSGRGRFIWTIAQYLGYDEFEQNSQYNYDCDLLTILNVMCEGRVNDIIDFPIDLYKVWNRMNSGLFMQYSYISTFMTISGIRSMEDLMSKFKFYLGMYTYEEINIIILMLRYLGKYTPVVLTPVFIGNGCEHLQNFSRNISEAFYCEGQYYKEFELMYTRVMDYEWISEECLPFCNINNKDLDSDYGSFKVQPYILECIEHTANLETLMSQVGPDYDSERVTSVRSEIIDDLDNKGDDVESNVSSGTERWVSSSLARFSNF